MDILFDIDGTLANIEHRLHFIQGEKKDWGGFYAACSDDEPIMPMINVLNSLLINPLNSFWFLTGRDEKCYDATKQWLGRYCVVPQWRLKVLMRPKRDHRKDYVLKSEMLDELLSIGVRPTIVFEDRQQCVDMWRARGIVCCQVADGKF